MIVVIVLIKPHILSSKGITVVFDVGADGFGALVAGLCASSLGGLGLLHAG